MDTNDAVLIANNNSSKEIKEVVQKINKRGFTEGKNNKKIFRPWGYYISIEEGSKWQIKQLFVKPGEALSLQLHNHRSEHWIVVSGTADVEIDNNKFSLIENQSTYIPLGSKHRLSNSKIEPLIIMSTVDHILEKMISLDLMISMVEIKKQKIIKIKFKTYQ